MGVVSSSGTSTPWVGAPSSSPTTAGAGLGSRPWAARTMPVPLATELDRTSSMPSTSRAAAVPTTSTMASRPPTSWKWTCSGGRRWSRPSTSARARNVASARRVTRSGRRASSTRPAMCPAVRTTRRLGGADDGVGGGDAAPEHGLEPQVPAAHRQAVEQRAHLVGVGARVDQRRRAPCRRRCPRSSGTRRPCARRPRPAVACSAGAGDRSCDGSGGRSCDGSCDGSGGDTSAGVAGSVARTVARSVAGSVAGSPCGPSSWGWSSSLTAGSAAPRRRRRSRCRCRPR